MDWFVFLLKLVAFCITLYLLLEFAIVCSVNTSTAMALTLAAVVAVCVLFVIFKRYNVARCDCCKQNYIKSNKLTHGLHLSNRVVN